MKQTADPAISALNATSVIADLWLGASADNAPIIIPTELGLENPHSAYVAIISDLG